MGYRNLLREIKVEPTSAIVKGKGPMLVLDTIPDKAASNSPVKVWCKPDTGWIKLSIDGSLSTSDGRAGTGMILRRDDGSVIFMACRALLNCSDALEAELEACLEGLKLSRQHSQLPLIIETDSSLLVDAVKSLVDDRSNFHVLVNDIRRLVSLDSCCLVTKASRTQVRVSDALAKFARTQDRTMTWLGSGPDCADRKSVV